MKSNAKLKLVTNDIGAIGFATAAGRQSPSHLSVSRPYGRPSAIAVTNTRLFSTVVRKPPIPRGHRVFIGKQEWR